MFISRDPIGLMGGDNVFAYGPNPTGWIDPFGLYGTIEEAKKAGLPKRGMTDGDVHFENIRAARRETMRRLNIPTSQSYTSRISKDPYDDRFRIQEIFNRDGKKIGELNIHQDGHVFTDNKIPVNYEDRHYHVYEDGKKQAGHITFDNGRLRGNNPNRYYEPRNGKC